MSKRQKKNVAFAPTTDSGRAGLFEPGGQKGPVDDINEYETLINGVSDLEQREFLQEASRFATTWQYLSSFGIELPLEIAAQVVDLKDASLTVRDRVNRMRTVNRQMMEFIAKHGREDSTVRQ